MRNWYDTQRHFEARMKRDIDLPEQRWEEGSHSGLPLLRMRAIKHAIRTGITTFLGWFSSRPSLIHHFKPPGPRRGPGYWGPPSSQPVSYLLKLAVVARGGADPAQGGTEHFWSITPEGKLLAVQTGAA
jgi:hypothetical protein